MIAPPLNTQSQPANPGSLPAPNISNEPSTTPEGAHLESIQPSKPKEEVGWRRLLRNFTPSWFSVPMGTGMVSILLHQLPYTTPWLSIISITIFCLNTMIFVLFLAVSVARYVLYPEIWSVMVRHLTQSLFLGTVPMALATVVNMVVLACGPAWGEWATLLAWGLWWVDAVVSVVVCCGMCWIMYVLRLSSTCKSVLTHLWRISLHAATLQSTTAIYLLPIVASIVASASGALIAQSLTNPDHAFWTLIVSYILWGVGVPLAMIILVIYFHRLMHHHLPPKEVIVSCFLPLGPLGQGGFAIMQLGKAAMIILPRADLKDLPRETGTVLYAIGLVVGLIMWAMAMPWLFIAVAAIARDRFPFNMGWWGFTFPLGTVVLSTIQLGKELDSMFFNVLGEVLAFTVVVLWLVVAAGTVRKSWTGEMFYAPCLSDLKPKGAGKVS